MAETQYDDILKEKQSYIRSLPNPRITDEEVTRIYHPFHFFAFIFYYIFILFSLIYIFTLLLYLKIFLL